MSPKDKNFHLHPGELDFLKDRSLFDRKRELTGRIVELLGKVEIEATTVYDEIYDIIPSAAHARRGKISRGENYLGLPYLLLDFPATFGKTGVFAFRTMVWWANPVMITFHLSGHYLDQLRNHFTGEFLKSLPGEYLICINTNEWEHHAGKNNFISLDEFFLLDEAIRNENMKQDFLKIAYTFPLEELSLTPQRCRQFILTLLKKSR